MIEYLRLDCEDEHFFHFGLSVNLKAKYFELKAQGKTPRYLVVNNLELLDKLPDGVEC